MKQVIRYQCEHCQKEFRTPDRHYCKMNPQLKNCFTCIYLRGWVEGPCIGEGEWAANYPDCAAEEPNWGDWDIEMIKEVNYDMQCERWEPGEYDWLAELN